MPYLVSVADPHDTLSKHHRWGPVLLTPAQVAAKLGFPGLRDLVVARGPSGRVTSVRLKAVRSARTMLSQDFRRALDLRSTWFNVRVLNLDPPLARALAARPVQLRGFVRGLRGVRLERQVNGGTWTTVKRVKTRSDGRFTVTVTARRTTSFRLATRSVAGGAVTVQPR